MPNKKKIIVVSVLVLTVAAVVSGFLILNKKNQPSDKNSPNSAGENAAPTFSQKVMFDPARQYPPFFPQGLPLDKPVDITNNSQIKITYPTDPFNAAQPTAGTNSSAQAAQPVNYLESTVTYISNVAMKQSADAFTQYLKNNGWTVFASNSTDNSNFIQGAKSRERLSYTYSQNTVDKKNYITLVHDLPDPSAGYQVFSK